MPDVRTAVTGPLSSLTFWIDRVRPQQVFVPTNVLVAVIHSAVRRERYLPNTGVDHAVAKVALHRHPVCHAKLGAKALVEMSRVGTARPACDL